MSEPFRYSEAEKLRIITDNEIEDARRERDAIVRARKLFPEVFDEFDPSAASEAERAMHPEQNW